MTHKKIFETFTKMFPMWRSDVSAWFPYGNNRIKIKTGHKKVFIFTYFNETNWSFKTVEDFKRGNRKMKERRSNGHTNCYRTPLVYPNIEVYLTKNELRFDDLAEKAGMYVSDVNKILHGKYEPRLQNIKRILKATGLSFDEAFYTYSYKPTRQKLTKIEKNKVYPVSKNIIYPNIRKFMVENNLSYYDLADAIDCDRITIRNILIEPNPKHKSDKHFTTLKYIRAILEVTGLTFEEAFAEEV